LFLLKITTVFLYVLSLPEVQADILGCNLGVQLTGTTSYSGGVWTSADTAITFLPDSNVDNPLVSASVTGTYLVTYTDNSCDMDTSLYVTFPPYPYTEVSDTALCNGTQFEIYALTDPISNPNDVTYTWYDMGGTQLGTGQYLTVNDEGQYIISISNACGNVHSDTAMIDYKLCDIKVPNVISLSSTDGNNLWFVTAEGIAEFECVIVNRWGNTIYTFNDVAGSWDGTTEAGKLVSEGTYFYRIIASDEAGEEYNLHGFIQVVH
jgi:gliding motility-associated-like protein